jgi:hypothetical protein
MDFRKYFLTIFLSAVVNDINAQQSEMVMQIDSSNYTLTLDSCKIILDSTTVQLLNC